MTSRCCLRWPGEGLSPTHFETLNQPWAQTGQQTGQPTARAVPCKFAEKTDLLDTAHKPEAVTPEGPGSSAERNGAPEPLTGWSATCYSTAQPASKLFTLLSAMPKSA